ncbi:metallo-beta-lactamase domain-containing protein 1-like [Clytia hemisphaerica]|uniref:Metallo-beta-lactamase domain-containing protein 1 n=1 Tax=Clytia hemisphaerica TaxID=252671 RepID=A0A7M5WKP9_9CNID
MSKIEILRTGYLYKGEDGIYHAASSCTLVRHPKMNVIVDPGGPWERQVILDAFKRTGLDCSDIDVVVGTHGHSDHVGNLNLFPTAKHIVGHDISIGDQFHSHDFKSGLTYTLVEGCLEVIPTPGQMFSGVSLIVLDSIDSGIVGICGDLFETNNDESFWPMFSENAALQLQSRNKLLSLCDYIIPGHSGMFSTRIKKTQCENNNNTQITTNYILNGR